MFLHLNNPQIRHNSFGVYATDSSGVVHCDCVPLFCLKGLCIALEVSR